mgnify:CR=1 FL=1|jgi:predicted Fe-S protein YdhL (DUF1289 family)
MSAPRNTEGRVASPCINVCQMHEPSGLCRGCARTIPEIAAWSRAEDAERERIWALLPARRATLQALGELATQAR